MKHGGIDKTAYAAMIVLLLFFMGVLYLKHSYARVQNYNLVGAPTSVDRDLLLISNYRALKDSELGKELELLDYETENLGDVVWRMTASAPAPAPAPARSETLHLSEHRVREGESLWSIASNYGISITALLTVNNLSAARRALTVGQLLKVPNSDGIMVTVRRGEAVSSLATRYRVPVQRIIAFNRLAGGSVRAGQRLFIPGSNLQPQGEDGTSAAAVAAAGSPRRTAGFINPLPGGTFTSPFGWRIHPRLGVRRHHNGIDISAPHGTRIVASKEGRVQYAGWISGYGRTVVIEHSNGMSTYYAHMSTSTVTTGQYVEQGQLIGRVGATGIATGPHLHFEIRTAAGLIDPAPSIGLSSRVAAGARTVATPTVVQQGMRQPSAPAPSGDDADNPEAPAASPARSAIIDVQAVPQGTPSPSSTVTGGGTPREGTAAPAAGTSG